MSHSTATIRFEDGTLFYGEFNGTVDVLLPFLYETEDERDAYWRGERVWKRCNNTEHTHEAVAVVVTYGGGWYWTAKACRDCLCVIEPLSLETMGEGTDFPFPRSGFPDWYQPAALQ